MLWFYPVVIYGCESWTVKKAEGRRIDAFEVWCWRRLLRVRWTARRSNQSILKEISPEYSLERLMLKLKLQYFGHLMQRTNSFWKDPDTGKDKRQEEKGTTEDEMVGWHHQHYDMSLSKLQELASCSPWGREGSDTTERLNWTECEEQGLQVTLLLKAVQLGRLMLFHNLLLT